MPACEFGAEANAVGAGTTQLVSIGSLAANVASLFTRSNKAALVSFAPYFVDVDALCATNPEVPEAFGAEDFVLMTLPDGPAAVEAKLRATAKLSAWVNYAAFLSFCQCKPPVLNPVRNCLHATNLSVPAGVGQLVALGTVQIEPAVYDSWPDTGTTWSIKRSGSWAAGAGGAGPGHDWDLEVLNLAGQWIALESNLTLPQGADAERNLAVQSQFKFGRTVQLRLRNSSGTARQVARLDYCFAPIVAGAPPLPPQPAVPDLPDMPLPTCTTSDLCLLVTELARSVSRLSAQLADVQQLVGGADQLSPIGSQAISGEGEVQLPVGTRAIDVELLVLGEGVYTSALGRPRGLMRAGSIRWGDGVGYSAREFVDADRFTRLRPQGALSLSWQLINGCSGTLRFMA